MTALALLAVTAAAVVLLAVVFRQGVAAALAGIVGILATVPGAYLAWAALPARRTPVHGRPAGRWDPVDLGVHQVIGGGPMPAYVPRPHDALLRVVLDRAVPVSRLVAVRGGSSTGKTRAAYEAVLARLADWQLDYPLDPAALRERLDAGVPARTVLWLGELRQYADADGGAAVLGRVADLLHGEGHLLITTVWPEQWAAYTAAARAGPGPIDPAGTAGRLLAPLPELTGQDPATIDPARGGVIDVPAEFTPADLHAAARAGDQVLAGAAAAAARAGQAGQVTQYLAGVPDLLDRYQGSGGDPYGQAVITAAIDATRLGHASPLPAALLEEAAVGYLTGLQRTKEIALWRDDALAWAAAELKGAVRALQPVPPPSGTGVAGYRVADYLDQHGRRARQDQLGPPCLWDALTAWTTSAGDLTRLGEAAEDRGLYRHAAALWTAAVARGNADAAYMLITFLRQMNSSDTTRAARWTAAQVSLDNLWGVDTLLRELRDVGASDAAATLATRAAAQVSLDDPGAVIRLLYRLHDVGAMDGVTLAMQATARSLATRAAAQVSLDDPGAVIRLLRGLRDIGANGAVATLLARDPAAHVSLDLPAGVATLLLRELHDAGTGDAAATLLGRDLAAQVRLDDPWGAAELLRELRAAGASDAAAALATRAAAHVSLDSLDNPDAVAELLRELRAAGAGDAAAALARRASAHLSLTDGAAVASLLRGLRAAGAMDAAATLLRRDLAAHVSLDDPRGVAELLRELRAAGAMDAAATLLARDLAAHVRLEDPWAVAALLRELRAAVADDAATLATRVAAQVSLDNPRAVAELLLELRDAGAMDAAATLATRAAAQVSLDNPWGLAALLQGLRAAGAMDAAAALATRAAAQVSLDDPGAVIALLVELRDAGPMDAAATLLARDPAAHVSLHDLASVAALLQGLRDAGADDAAAELAKRAANAGMFEFFLHAEPGEAIRYRFGREPDGTPAHPWRWQRGSAR